MLVHLGEEEYSFPSPALAQLADHTELHQRGDWRALRAELEGRGYLRVRGLHLREQVLAARTGLRHHLALLEHIQKYFSCPRIYPKIFQLSQVPEYIQKYFSCPGIYPKLRR